MYEIANYTILIMTTQLFLDSLLFTTQLFKMEMFEFNVIIRYQVRLR